LCEQRGAPLDKTTEARPVDFIEISLDESVEARPIDFVEVLLDEAVEARAVDLVEVPLRVAESDATETNPCHSR